MEPILSIRGVCKSFGDVKAVKGISFDVRKGTITGLLGRNGAGKTTTIRMITGIFMPDEGSIEWRGGAHGSFQDSVGYLPEERGLYRQMKLVEHLLFLAEIKGRPAATTKASAENGPIAPGDLLTTSATPAHAMKASPAVINGVEIYPTGAIVGKALEPLEEGRGVIQVLVTLR